MIVFNLFQFNLGDKKTKKTMNVKPMIGC